MEIMRYIRGMALCILLMPGAGNSLSAQQSGVLVNMAMLDGIELTPVNIFDYQIMNKSGYAREAEVNGTVRYRNSKMLMAYSFHTVLQPGTNQFSRIRASNAQWKYSDNALKELFNDLGKLPQGTYEYCVEIRLKEINPERALEEPVDACIYNTVNDIFLINLLSPENDAKIYEYYPMLSWIVNYPFSSSLSYKVRLAELKPGQNNENAVIRNNPVYQDNSVMTTSLIYPVTGKPLQKDQPYVWTVDAYYKGILLGGAEVWKFTIVEDPELIGVQADQSYYDFVSHVGETRLNVTGNMKLKYWADGNNDTLAIKLRDANNKEINMATTRYPLKNSYNWLVIPIENVLNLKHKGKYSFEIINKAGKHFELPITYYNPLYIK